MRCGYGFLIKGNEISYHPLDHLKSFKAYQGFKIIKINQENKHEILENFDALRVLLAVTRLTVYRQLQVFEEKTATVFLKKQ